MVGRKPSTRLNVKGFDNIRLNRVCSSPSAVKTDRGRLCTVDNMPAFQCGNPGTRSSTLTRESENSSLHCSYPVMSHGVLPSQIRTLDSVLLAASAMTSGGGAKGQPACLAIGYSGIMEVASVSVLVSVSDISFLDMDDLGRARRGCPAGALRLVRGWGRVVA